MTCRALLPALIGIAAVLMPLASSAQKSALVTVVNGQSNPVLTEAAFPRQPYVLTRTCVPPTGVPYAFCPVWGESSDQLLVIETISVQVYIPPTADCSSAGAQLEVLANNGGVMAIVYVPLSKAQLIVSGGFPGCVGTISTRVLGVPMSHGQVTITGSGGGGRINVFGYQLDSRSPSLGP